MLLQYRDFSLRDLGVFAQMVAHIFRDDTYPCSPFINGCIMRHELLDYLKRQNYAKMVVHTREGSGHSRPQDEPVGIFVASIGKAPLHPLLLLLSLMYRLPLLFSAAGRRYLAYVRGLHRTDAHLLLGKPLDTELKLFVVKHEYQNEGIGRHLLMEFEAACQAHGVHRFFLFTDSYCNVEYYTKRGFHLEAEQTYDFFHEVPPAQYYLFTYDL